MTSEREDGFVLPTSGPPGRPIEPPDASIADRERTFLLGLGMVAAGFVIAELLHSLVWLPLALVVPGIVLTIVGLFSLLGSAE